MRSGTKVLLETIQVARHVGKMGLRPLEKVAVKAAKATEEVALWALKLPPVEEALAEREKKQVLDSYSKAKDVVGESVASLTHQSWMSALQSGAEGASACLRQAGIQTRVIGPFDPHWNTLKVLKDLRNSAGQAAAKGGGGPAVQLTPKRFVQFMREAEATKRRGLQRDPVEDYVDWILTNGSIRAMGPMMFEKKLYKDVVRLICFAFDRALTEANGTDIWGHRLRVKVKREFGDHLSGTKALRKRSRVGVDQVEAVVDQMLRSEDLKAPVVLAGMQRQMLINCSLMILQLLEDLTSERHLQVSMLGHNLRVRLEPLPMEQVLRDVQMASELRFPVNHQAIDELVEALIDEPEVQLVMVPDLLESEVYRLALHRMLCIAEFMLSQLKIRLFGAEVRMSLTADQPAQVEGEEKAEDGVPMVLVPQEELQRLLDKIQDERRRIELELNVRRGEPEVSRSSLDMPSALKDGGEEVRDGVHEFQTMAAQDRLSRSLAIQRTVSVPIELAFQMVSDFNAYPSWMPFCTSAKTLSTEKDGKSQMCEVGFGLETGTVLGTVGDKIRYRVSLQRPDEEDSTSPLGTQHPEALRVARVVADTLDGFRYGKRLVYDWRFIENTPGETDVRLDMFFQAKSVFFLPLWDSMQATITSVMMKKFQERAAQLTEK
eukprot:CAMPEP_0197621036 /NCGR_PEP_ID=MMETSP1338-20131121/1685_1 /TAXON_ID=43686 ORGANISM="Pelagodinium beii, Strain RCC1491" /NCGR_SAMPLE_ID=MMETSP1338 /ASSEMBLY_ACC=CAM_ASM_000754 /LENGTH=660 /DNA_ID=CAMNT_0043190361 /DNA_START=218 /DNA_END=2201 /DNA_ORIENTATION=+